MKRDSDRLPFSRSLLGLLVITVAACGGGGGGKPPSGGPATASAACAEVHAARAAFNARCYGGSVAQWRGYQDASENCAAYDRHVDEGTVAYQPEGWAACMAEFDQPCDTAVFDSCEYDVLHGLAADGDPCEDTAVCGTISACYSLTADTCDQICVRGGELNQTCGIYCGGSTPCNESDFCAHGLVCRNDVCVEGGAVGDACGGPSVLACQPHLVCNPDPGATDDSGTCALRAAGGPCPADSYCPLDHFCSEGICTARRPQNAACVDSPTGCAAWLACDPDTQLCRPAGGIGQSCAPYPGAPTFLTCSAGACADGLSCELVAGAGQGCAVASCGPGLVCDSAALTCVPCS